MAKIFEPPGQRKASEPCRSASELILLSGKTSRGETLKIRGKLLVSVLAAVIAVLVAASWLGYTNSKKTLVKEIRLHAESTLKAYAWEIDSEIASMPIMVHGLAMAIASLYPTDIEHIKGLIRISLEINPRAFGSTIAFAPGAFPGTKELVAPYYYRSSDGLAYKDLATSSYPFYRDNKLLGVVTADIALDELTDEIEKLVVGQTGRAFLLSKNGAFLTLGEREVNLEETIFDYARGKPDEEKIDELGKEMVAGRSGFVSTTDPLEGETAWVVFGPVPTTNWSLGIVFPEEELLGELLDMKRNSAIRP